MKHFKRSEFACGCGCGFDAVDWELVEVLEDLREYLGSRGKPHPVIINSGCRCVHWNGHEEGTKGSKHTLGIAADIRVRGIATNLTYYNYLDGKYPDKYGIGLYATWVHIDMRQIPARW